MLHLKRLVTFLEALIKFVTEWKEQNGKADKSQGEVMTVAQLLEQLGRRVSGVNLLEIEAYLKSSKVFLFALSVRVSLNRSRDRKEDCWLLRHGSRKRTQ